MVVLERKLEIVLIRHGDVVERAVLEADVVVPPLQDGGFPTGLERSSRGMCQAAAGKECRRIGEPHGWGLFAFRGGIGSGKRVTKRVTMRAERCEYRSGLSEWRRHLNTIFFLSGSESSRPRSVRPG